MWRRIKRSGVGGRDTGAATAAGCETKLGFWVTVCSLWASSWRCARLRVKPLRFYERAVSCASRSAAKTGGALFWGLYDYRLPVVALAILADFELCVGRRHH